MLVDPRVPSGRLPLLIVLLLIATSAVSLQTDPTEPAMAGSEDFLGNAEQTSMLVSGPRSAAGVVDVPSWRVGDRWTYDGEFDVAQLVASGGVSAQIGILTGTLNRNLQDIITMTVENRSTLVYEVRSVGTFGANGVSLDGYNGDLSIDYDSTDLIRVSDLANIRLSMGLEVDFSTFGGLINIDVADLTIVTTYRPPQEGHDFPISVGDQWNTSYTVSTEWSGSSDYFTIPEDTEEEGGNSWSVVAAGNPGVPYNGCSSSYNITSYDDDGNVVGFHWYCPHIGNDAWQHVEQSLGLIIDFRLTAYSPVTRQRTIAVDLQSSAWLLDANISVWLNVTDASGQPIASQTLQFRYEAASDFRTVTADSNGSAHVIFDTANFNDPSPSTDDYASHGVIGWIGGTEEVGVSTITLDQNLLEVDLIASEVGVTVSRTRGDATLVLSPAIGYDAIPGDDLTFSVPVVNRGLLASVPTELEITAPDGTTSRAAVPSLSTFETVTIGVSWSVPTVQPIGMVSVVFEVDPDGLEVRDGNLSNNGGEFMLFIGRLPTAALAEVAPFLTVTDVLIDATASFDPDGGDVSCLFTIQDGAGGNETREQEDCTITWLWMDDGVYTVSVAVIDDENDVDSTSIDLTVLNRPPVVNVSSDRSELPVMSEVTFNAHDHDDIDTISPSAPVSILWDADCSEGRVTLECTLTPQVEGWYEVALTATDDDGAQTVASHGVLVTNIAPWDATILAYSNDTMLELDTQMVWHVEEDQPIVLVGRANDSANDLDSLRQLWQPDFDIDPSDARWLDGAETRLNISYGESGMHTVSLDVYDDDNASTGVVRGWIEVSNVAPWIEPFDDLLPIGEDQILTVTAGFGDSPSDVDSLVACWDLDPMVNSDETGAADDDCDIEGETMANGWRRAETAPSQIVFHVTDDDGERAVQALNITIRNIRPKAVANVTSLQVEVGEEVVFNAEGTTDSSADMLVLTYRWDFDGHTDTDDDGFTANDIDQEGFEVSHVFTEPGSYLVRLTVRDESAESTVDLQIVVNPGSTSFLGIIDTVGGGDPAIVVGLGVVLLILLTVLGVGMLRKEDESTGEGWEKTIQGGYGDAGSPTAPPPSHAFEHQSQQGPPLPAAGLPEGWTMDQWAWYGEQWLADHGTVSEASGKSRDSVSLVTAAEPMAASPAAESMPHQQAMSLFDEGYFTAAAAPETTTSAVAGAGSMPTAVLQPAAEPPLSDESRAASADPASAPATAAAPVQDEDPFAALDLDL